MVEATVKDSDGIEFQFRFSSTTDHYGKCRIKSVEIRVNRSAGATFLWHSADSALKNSANANLEITNQADIQEVLRSQNPKISADVSSPLLFTDAVDELLQNFTADLFPEKSTAERKRYIVHLTRTAA